MGEAMFRRGALLLTIALAGPAFAHGGSWADPPPGPGFPTPAGTPGAPPNDPRHRCLGLRGLAGELPPDSAEPSDPPPPPGDEQTEALFAASCLRVRVTRDDGSVPRGLVARLVPDADVVPESFAIEAERHRWSERGLPGDGLLVFDHVAARPHRLLVTVPGLPTFTAATGLLPGGEESEVRLPPRCTPRSRTLRVTVLDVDGEPLARPTVELLRADGRRARATGADGTVELTVTGVGALHVRAGTVGGCMGPAPPCACAHDVPEDVHALTLRILPPPATRALVFPGPPAETSGAYVRVVDRARGTATGRLWLGARDLPVITFDDALLDVVWAPAAEGRPVVAGAVRTSVAPGARLALTTPPTRPVTGRVVRPDGSPVRDALVAARSSSDPCAGALRVETRSDDDGCFRFEAVAGAVCIDACATGLSSGAEPATAEPGARDVVVVVREERLR